MLRVWGIALKSFVSCVGLLLVAAGISMALEIVGAWQPCFQSISYDSRVCMRLQSDIGMDYSESGPLFERLWLYWWSAFGGLLFATLVTFLVRPLRIFRRPLGLAFAATAGGFILVDYVVVPLFNGGYMSHDSPPGAGLLTCWSLTLAGLILIAGMARASLLRPTLPAFMQDPSAATAPSVERYAERQDSEI
ncbi:MAG: hypothetical protein JWQ43_4220 [Glaciihabitans sp.]|nr:hypothetical protein [Glaciihabitans sp.]